MDDEDHQNHDADRTQGFERRRWRISSIPVVILALAGVFAIIGALTFEILRAADERDAAVARQLHNYQFSIAVASLESAIDMSELALDAYVSTTDTHFLGRYEKNRKKVNSRLEELSTLVTHSPEKVVLFARLRDLVMVRLKTIDQIAAARPPPHIAERMLHGSAATTQLKKMQKEIVALREYAARDLAARAQASRHAATAETRTVYAIIVVGGVMLLVAVLLSMAAFRDAVDQRVAWIAQRGRVRAPASDPQSLSPFPENGRSSPT